MIRKQWVLILAFNALIAVGFYVSNLGAGYERLSSDLHNIVPMCQKFDDVSLFKGDVFAGDTANFKYYTPFFITKLRALAWINGGDYVAAINMWLAGMHLLFGLGWFLLAFRLLNKQFWPAFFISILLRGIVWLPGSEIWGISNIWSLMPRTVYIGLLPFALLLLFTDNKRWILLGGFLIGLLFNFHPITGLGGILLYYTLLFCLKWIFKQNISWFSILLQFMFTILGMLPFVITYFGKTELAMDYNIQEYQEAFSARIPSYFLDTQRFLAKWMQAKFLFYMLPLVMYLLYGWLLKGVHLKRALTICLLTLVLIVFPTLSVPIEQWLNDTLGSNLRMAFQLIRIQKLAVLPAYFAIGFLLLQVTSHFRSLKKWLPLGVFFYVILGVVSASGGLKSIPFISDDITKEIYPDVKSIADGSAYMRSDFDKMSVFVQNNTSKDAILYASFMYRSSTKRAVVLDKKGASILIEGNPKKLIAWHKERKEFQPLSIEEQLLFLKQKGVKYIITEEDEYTAWLVPIHKEGNVKLYRI
ncbi:hypothetical protein SCB49_01577 [unidentified eubacterium SCB49]|nr:hypothetical protein SCB49_01577 [unidentified eubacterium SCB49]